MNLLVFGSVNIDEVYHVDRFARDGETIASLSYARHEGGKGLNQSIALAKAGQAVRFAGAVGEDGAYLLDYLNEYGVDASRARVTGTPTGRAIIQVDASGRNCIILYAGANQEVTPDMIDSALEGMGEGDAILAQNEISRVDYVIEAASRRGLRIFFNASPLTRDMDALGLDRVSVFLVNEIEGRGLTGRDDPEGMLDAMLERYPRTSVLLTLGDKGAVYADGSRRVSQAAIPVEAIDSTGAGDTFTGYFLQAELSGERIETALRRAAQAASIAVGRPGAGRSIPYADEVDEALARLDGTR
ncbi:MAG: ribokinase [Oscillospiraceae bacterium]|jgi:ribokinase|nr:ribokinase [Oscillospiraceae bacterium]